MAAVFSVAVAVNLELPAAMPTLEPIDGFPPYEMQMAVPPFPAADIGAEPLMLESSYLLDSFATAFAAICITGRLICHLGYIHPAAIFLYPSPACLRALISFC